MKLLKKATKENKQATNQKQSPKQTENLHQHPPPHLETNVIQAFTRILSAT